MRRHSKKRQEKPTVKGLEVTQCDTNEKQLQQFTAGPRCGGGAILFALADSFIAQLADLTDSERSDRRRRGRRFATP
eukprot:COSAG06_NODE_2815_length_6235_cov_641.255704_7_plen_77_part_00